MRLYSVECFGVEFSMYLKDSYTKMPDVQMDILSHYISVDRNPFSENETRAIIERIYKSGMITDEQLEKYIPFAKIKMKKERNKMSVHE